MGNDLASHKTQWSLIVRAQGEGPQARAALGQLLQRYERTILSTIRYFRHPPDQTAEEVKQESARAVPAGSFARSRSSLGGRSEAHRPLCVAGQPGQHRGAHAQQW